MCSLLAYSSTSLNAVSSLHCSLQLSAFRSLFFSLWAISGPEHYCQLFSPVLQLSAFVAFLFCQLSEALCQRCSYRLHFQSLQVLCSVSYLQPRALTQAQPLWPLISLSFPFQSNGKHSLPLEGHCQAQNSCWYFGWSVVVALLCAYASYALPCHALLLTCIGFLSHGPELCCSKIFFSFGILLYPLSQLGFCSAKTDHCSLIMQYPYLISVH